MTDNSWYNTLVKPPFTPPSTYFPVAWGFLYTLMTISFFIIISKPHSRDKYISVNLFLLQLILNFTWSYIFFEVESINLALIDVTLLLIALIFTIKYFFKISKVAGHICTVLKSRLRNIKLNYNNSYNVEAS